MVSSRSMTGSLVNSVAILRAICNMSSPSSAGFSGTAGSGEAEREGEFILATVVSEVGSVYFTSSQISF